MSSDPNIFDCFLDPPEMFAFYQRIGTILRYDRDIANERINGKALHNTLVLLQNISIIQKCDDEFSKLQICQTLESFCTSLIARIKESYPDEVDVIINCEKHYDEAKNQFFIYVNTIPLRYMGLAMLMEQTGEFERIGNRIYFIGIKNYQEKIKKKPLVSIEELQKKLLRDSELGEQAEKFAWKYEIIRLKQGGIDKEPLKISSMDVMAGYDIVSYESVSSENYDRFIEVKAVSKNGFFWSRNEYEAAKQKGNHYYLYLVDLRKIDAPGYVPEIIQNPAVSVMTTDGWFVEPQSYHIKRL